MFKPIVSARVVGVMLSHGHLDDAVNYLLDEDRASYLFRWS
jgi:hypothetical protein